MPGKIYNLLMDVATGQFGYVTADDARALGVATDRLRKMAERGTIDRIAYGLYRIPAVAPTALDQYMEATLWPRGGGVLCHDTALDLHDLCDVNPAKVHVTVAEDLRITREIPAVYRLHHRDLDPGDVTSHEGIAIVTPLRAIRDGIEAHLGAHLISQAIETARRRGAITKEQERQLATTRRGVPTRVYRTDGPEEPRQAFAQRAGAAALGRRARKGHRRRPAASPAMDLVHGRRRRP